MTPASPAWSRPARATTSCRGVSIEGRATIIDDLESDRYWDAGISLFERYNGPYTDEMRPFVEAMMNKRVVVVVEPERIRSWDHRKLEMAKMPAAGSTAALSGGRYDLTPS